MSRTNFVSLFSVSLAMALSACGAADEPGSGATDLTGGTVESELLAPEEAARSGADAGEWPAAVARPAGEKVPSDTPESAIASGCSIVQYCNHPDSVLGTTCIKQGCTLSQAQEECSREAQNVCGTILQKFVIFYLAGPPRLACRRKCCSRPWPRVAKSRRRAVRSWGPWGSRRRRSRAPPSSEGGAQGLPGGMPGRLERDRALVVPLGPPADDRAFRLEGPRRPPSHARKYLRGD